MHRISPVSGPKGEHNTALRAFILEGSFRKVMARLLEMALNEDDQKFLTRKYLIDSVEAEMGINLTGKQLKALEKYKSLFRELHRRDIPDTAEEPNFSVLSIYARLGLRYHVSETIFDNPKICAEERATAQEFLQVAMLDRYLYKKSFGYPILEHFRRAQGIRDFEGITRPAGPVKCFTSMDDIRRLEYEIKIGYTANFLAQCCLLNLVDARHLDMMLTSLCRHSGLTDFFTKAFPSSEIFTDPFVDFYTIFGSCFRPGRFSKPRWTDALLYFRISDEMISSRELVSVVESIPEEALDSYLNYFLLYLYRCTFNESWSFSRMLIDRVTRGDPLPEVISSLLNRGASLHFTTEQRIKANEEMASKDPSILRDADLPEQTRSDCNSSLALLAQLSLKGVVHCSTFAEHFCCSTREDRTPMISPRQPPALACLAARSCKLPEEYSRIPDSVCSWVQIHLELEKISRNIQDYRPHRRRLRRRNAGGP